MTNHIIAPDSIDGQNGESNLAGNVVSPKGRGGLIPQPESPCIERPSYSLYYRKTTTKEGTRRAGVWYHGLKQHGKSAPVPIDIWICSPLHVEAITSCQGSDFGRLLRFKNTLGAWREWAMPMHLLKGYGEELRGELLSMGLEIDPDGHRYFNRYILSQHPSRSVTAATSTGWNSPSLFIMPRQNIGEGDAIYQSDAAVSGDYGTSGTLDGWRDSIGAACPGNPILMLAVGCALAGPLLLPLQAQGGGFHVIADSSIGKSTALQAACSVWGHGEDFKRTWQATGNGIEGVAVLRNDTLLALDEMGSAPPKDIGGVVYALANGEGKTRANRNGSAKVAKRWRLLMFSTGEKRLATIMAMAGQQVQAGQEIRLVEVEGVRRYGCWDNLHGRLSGAELSEALKVASITDYGQLGPEFVRRLIDSGKAGDLPQALRALTNKFNAEPGQEGRVAERFAIVALALEMAAKWGLVPLSKGEAVAAMVELFKGWKDARGAGSGEDRAILKGLADFISRNGPAMFSSKHDENTVVRDRAGWVKDVKDSRCWMLTSEGLRRAVPGFDLKRITAALDKAGWLVEKDNDRHTKKVRTQEGSMNLYHIVVPPDQT